jgi:hypothetical protein
MSERKSWTVHVTKEVCRDHRSGARFSCAVHPAFTVHSKSEEGALSQARQLVGPDGGGAKFNIRVTEEE